MADQLLVLPDSTPTRPVTAMLAHLLVKCDDVHCLVSAAYEVEAVGRDGTTRPFGKPWFLVLLMFAGEGFARQK